MWVEDRRIMTSVRQPIILLRGCTSCRRVFWVYHDGKKLDCSECGHPSNNILWTPVPGFVVDAPKVFVIDETQGK